MVSLPSVHRQPAQLDLRGKRGKESSLFPSRVAAIRGRASLAKSAGGYHALNRLSLPYDTLEKGIFATHGHGNDAAYERVGQRVLPD